MGECLYDCGIDVMGSFVCVALYFGSMHQEGKEASSFRALIVLVSAGFVANAIMFSSSLVLELRTLSFVLVMLSKMLDLVMIYLFYRYVRVSLDFKGKLVDWADRCLPLLMVLEMLVIVSNAFYPTTFWLDENVMPNATVVGFLRPSEAI